MSHVTSNGLFARWATFRDSLSHDIHMNESCLTYESVTSWHRVNSRAGRCFGTHWVTPRTWMSHVTRMNKSRHVTESICALGDVSGLTESDLAKVMTRWVMSHIHASYHIWLSHVTHDAVGSCRRHGNVSHVTNAYVMSRMNESCHTLRSQILLWAWQGESCHAYVMSHEWVVSHYAISKWVMSHTHASCHIWMSHVPLYRVIFHSKVIRK